MRSGSADPQFSSSGWFFRGSGARLRVAFSKYRRAIPPSLDHKRVNLATILFVVTAFMRLRAQLPDESGHYELKKFAPEEMMSRPKATRRTFLASSAAGSLAAAMTPHTSSFAQDTKPRSANERLGVGIIGLRYQGSVIAHKAAMYGDIVAVCDVDKNVRDQAKASFGSTPRDFEDYQDLLTRKDVDVITIGTPDHWHTKMVIDACRAGKDVYCEKPLTLTIDEGKKITRRREGDGPCRASRFVAAERSSISTGGRDGPSGSHRQTAKGRRGAGQECDRRSV